MIVRIISTWSFFKSFQPKKGSKATNTQGETECVGKYEKNNLLKREENKKTRTQK